MELTLAFIGFGNVARAFARLLVKRRGRLAADYDLTWRTTAIATASRGCVLSDSDLNLSNAVELAEGRASLTTLEDSIPVENNRQVIERCKAAVVIETTPLDPQSGEPATSFIRLALSRGLHVVTANKGPLAFAYHQLEHLAKSNRVFFRFEGAVMDGTPVFNLVEECLPGTNICGFSGVLNSTTNLILTGMQVGRSFEDCLVEAQRLGIAEANPDHDIDGWDAAVKAAALANVLMGSDIRPVDIVPTGIRNITAADLTAAKDVQSTIRLIARGYKVLDRLNVTVMPEKVSLLSPLALVHGTSNALILETDLMGELVVMENNPGVDQTAYALLSDLIRIRKDISRD